MNKRILAALSAAVMALSLPACTSTQTQDTPAEDTSAVTAADSTAAAAEETAVFTVPAFAASPMRDIPATEFVRELHVGWNLGNTLDATKDDPTGDETVTDWETAWGQPVTMKAHIDSVAAQGFDTLRLPVTWTGKFGDAPDYKIREDWLARVKEIADYALDNDMNVIINCHHEDWNMPTEENLEKSSEILTALWTQIAEYFKDYNEHLIFEGMNEPRLKGTPMEWNGGNEEARNIINIWNQKFVDTVRATGGNNAHRMLMVPTYAASSSDNVLADFTVPDDPQVIVSLHAYLPYAFALAEPDSAKDTWSADNSSDTGDIDMLMAKLKDNFLDKGIPVIIGEYGCRNRFNTDDRAACAGYYTARAAEYGIPVIWWDNNSFVQGEAFGLLDRSTLEWRYPSIISAIMDARDNTPVIFRAGDTPAEETASETAPADDETEPSEDAPSETAPEDTAETESAA
ncbi:MAG: glycoside hydrolase family 5 protein [Oscillospiraceae bacterium]|nr:glycoside hydrolase family 5 protein [Oscillospiraceae bacterium]